jgi:hypothetical protein
MPLLKRDFTHCSNSPSGISRRINFSQSSDQMAEGTWLLAHQTVLSSRSNWDVRFLLFILQCRKGSRADLLLNYSQRSKAQSEKLFAWTHQCHCKIFPKRLAFSCGKLEKFCPIRTNDSEIQNNSLLLLPAHLTSHSQIPPSHLPEAHCWSAQQYSLASSCGEHALILVFSISQSAVGARCRALAQYWSV